MSGMNDNVDSVVGPHTHGGPDLRFKECKCSVCGCVKQCTPMTDFYTRPDDPTGPLFCERCILRPNAQI